MLVKNKKLVITKIALVMVLISGVYGVIPVRAIETTGTSIFPDETIRVSISSTGDQGNGISKGASISEDGRYIAFYSTANNLVPTDTNGTDDIFLRDTQSGATTRISVDSNGTQANAGSYNPTISSDGRFIAFDSYATNLVPGDTNGMYDVFVHDMLTGTTTRVSVDSVGAQAIDGASYYASISADGSSIAFYSFATNLVTDDSNGVSDVFVRDLNVGITRRASVDSVGAQANGASSSPSISANGRFVAYQSSATNLVANDVNGCDDIFLYDITTNTTTSVSVDSNGIPGNNSSYTPSVSANGQSVAFYSAATNLVAGDTNGLYDVFVHNTSSGATTRVSVDSNGTQTVGDISQFPSISADGRYIAFESFAPNLAQGDTNKQRDVFVHDMQTGITIRASVSPSGGQAALQSGDPSISADGSHIAFTSTSPDLVVGDTNGTSDVFVHRQVLLPTLLVTNTRDSGPGSLRQAILDADPGATVTFAPTLANQIITLASNLVVDKNLTIDGSGPSSQVTISGGNVAHIVVQNSSTVAISTLTIINGSGGAIVSNGDLTIINSTLRNNSSNGDCGAINSAGSLTIKNTTIHQNYSTYNGGGNLLYREFHQEHHCKQHDYAKSGRLRGGSYIHDGKWHGSDFQQYVCQE